MCVKGDSVATAFLRPQNYVAMRPDQCLSDDQARLLAMETVLNHSNIPAEDVFTDTGISSYDGAPPGVYCHNIPNDENEYWQYFPQVLIKSPWRNCSLYSVWIVVHVDGTIGNIAAHSGELRRRTKRYRHHNIEPINMRAPLVREVAEWSTALSEKLESIRVPED